MQIVKSNVREILVSYNNKKLKGDSPRIKTVADSHLFILDGFDRGIIGLQEQFVCMYLNRSNAILGVYRTSTGGITGTVADIRLILSVALKIAATGLILAHNHPSGNLTPSGADLELTRKVNEAAKLMDILLLDHLILDNTGQRYLSFAEEGFL